MRLRPATKDDLGYIRSLAGRRENWAFLTDEDDAALALYLSEPSSNLLIWDAVCDADRPLGYALFCDVGMPGRVVELRRLCLDQPGQGDGAEFLQALIDHAFVDYSASRLWLDCSDVNLRALHVYNRAGFTQEGRLRAHDYIPKLGSYVDAVLFGMLRDEWQALGRRSGLAACPPDA